MHEPASILYHFSPHLLVRITKFISILMSYYYSETEAIYGKYTPIEIPPRVQKSQDNPGFQLTTQDSSLLLDL